MLDLKKENYFTIFVNGKRFNCSKFMSIKDLLLYLEYDLNTVIIEYNNIIINLSNFDNFFVKKNDTIEIITIVGGG